MAPTRTAPIGTTTVHPAVLARFRDETDDLADGALRHCEEFVPGLTALPGRMRAAGLDAIRYSIALRLDLAEDGRDSTAEDEGPLRTYFRSAADRGIPLHMQLLIIRRTIAFAIHRYWLLAGPEHTDDMLEFTARMSRFHHRLEQISVDAYCQRLGGEQIAGGVRAAHAEALLAGTLPPPTGGTRPPLAERYLLVVLPGRGGPAPLDRLDGDPRWMHVVQDGADVVLVPEGPGAAAIADELTVAARTAGRPTAVAVPVATPRDVPAAHERARALLDLTSVIGGAPRLVTPDDALPERLVAADPEVAGRLVALLDRLAAHPGLQETVDAFLECDLDRSATAERLHVHRRTLTQRLHRIRELTGYDARTTRGVQVLGLALTARGLARGAG